MAKLFVLIQHFAFTLAVLHRAYGGYRDSVARKPLPPFLILLLLLLLILVLHLALLLLLCVALLRFWRRHAPRPA